jgi:hypothetical protein
VKKYKIIILSLIFVSLFSVPVLAETIQNPVSDKYGDIIKIVNSFMQWVRGIAIIALLAYTSYGGYTKLTAGGDPEKDKKAMMTIRSGMIGFIIMVAAPFIVEAVGALLGIDTI